MYLGTMQQFIFICKITVLYKELQRDTCVKVKASYQKKYFGIS